MQASLPFGKIAGAFDPDLAEHGLQSPFMKPLLHAFLSIAAFHRRGSLARTPNFDVRFQQLPHQFHASFLEFSFQIAFSQTAGLLRAQKRLQRREAFTRWRKGVTIDCRLSRHRSALPQLPRRVARQRINQHRLG